MDEDNRIIYRFNNIEHYYSVYLYNLKDDIFFFNSSAIEELVIEESVFNIFTKGTMTFRNDFNSFENKYNFNKANRDYLVVDIIPKLDDDSNRNTLNPDVWQLKYIFVIYNIEEITGDNPEEKYKKLYFWDWKYQILMEKNANFSTAIYANNFLDDDIKTIPLSKREDQFRKVQTGCAIRGLLENVFGENEKFNDIWNDGLNDIFFTSNPSNKAYDDLMYLYNAHISTDGDFSILSKERFTEEWKLENFKSIIDKALDGSKSNYPGEYQLEKFLVSMLQEDVVIPNRKLVPEGSDDPTQTNIQMGDLSIIDHYELFEMSYGDSSNKINTQLIYDYNYDTQEFEIKHSNITDIKDFYQRNYTDSLKINNNESTPLFYIDKLKEENRNVHHMYINNINDTILDTGAINVLRNNVFLNTGIMFSVVGSTHRKPNRFFSISKYEGFVPNSYEYLLQGQWYCIGVTHKFFRDKYENTIMGVKLNTVEAEESS